MPIFTERNKNTLAVVAIVLTIATTAVTTTWWLATELSDIRAELANYEDDRYTLTMASENALRQAIANPGQAVPDPRNPGEYFKVEIGE